MLVKIVFILIYCNDNNNNNAARTLYIVESGITIEIGMRNVRHKPILIAPTLAEILAMMCETASVQMTQGA